jgi:4-hydroxy-tetrahydrodipicolinate reductase
MSRSKPYKVILWGPGYTGSQALREIARRPELELVGCLAYSDAKAGRDATRWS